MNFPEFISCIFNHNLFLKKYSNAKNIVNRHRESVLRQIPWTISREDQLETRNVDRRSGVAGFQLRDVGQMSGNERRKLWAVGKKELAERLLYTSDDVVLGSAVRASTNRSWARYKFHTVQLSQNTETHIWRRERLASVKMPYLNYKFKEIF